MALFGSDKKKGGPRGPVFANPVDPGWVHNKDGSFYPFLDLDPESLHLKGVGGVYLIWHAGVHPEWVYAGVTNDMASAFHSAGTEPSINVYDKNGGLFVAWAIIKEEYRRGMVKYIEENFKTLVPNSGSYNDNTQAVPVFAPKSKHSR